MIQIPVSWNEKKLSEISHKISDGIHTTPIYKDDSDISFINGNNIKNNRIELFNNTKKVGLSEYNKYRRPLGEKTILMSINGTIGNTAFYRNEKVILGKSVAFINLKDTVDKTFISYYLNTRIIKKYWENELTGSTIKNLSIKSIKNANIYLPPLPEQRAIADILSTWDQAIEKMEKLIEAKEKRFEGLLFNTIWGNDWEKIKLGALFGSKVIVEKGKAKTKEDFKVGMIPVIAGGQTYAYFSEQATHDIDILTISASGANAGYVWFHDYPIWASDCNVIYVKEGSTKFLYYVLKTLQKRIYTLQSGGAQPHVYSKDLKILDVVFPDQVLQYKIANILTKYENEIKLLKELIEKYKEQKRGLMQKLLTGEWRVKV